MGIVIEVLVLLGITIFTWAAGGWALFKLENPVAGWLVALSMLIVQGVALWRICTIPLQ